MWYGSAVLAPQGCKSISKMLLRTGDADYFRGSGMQLIGERAVRRIVGATELLRASIGGRRFVCGNKVRMLRQVFEGMRLNSAAACESQFDRSKIDEPGKSYASSIKLRSCAFVNCAMSAPRKQLRYQPTVHSKADSIFRRGTQPSFAWARLASSLRH